MSFGDDLQTGLIAQAAALIAAAKLTKDANSDSIDFQEQALADSLAYQEQALSDTLAELADARADSLANIAQGRTESIAYLNASRADNIAYQETTRDRILANQDLAHTRAMDKQQQALDFAKYRYKQWEDIYIPIQEDVSKYIEELTEQGVSTRETNDIQTQLQKANSSTVGILACRGISRSGLEAQLLNDNILLADMNKANVRSTAEERIYLRKQNFIAMGINGGDALAREIYNIDNNMGNLIMQDSAVVSTTLGNTAATVGNAIRSNGTGVANIISASANQAGTVITNNSNQVANTIMSDASRYASLVSASANNVSNITASTGSTIADYVVGFGNSVAETISTYATMEHTSALYEKRSLANKKAFGQVRPGSGIPLPYNGLVPNHLQNLDEGVY